MDPPLTTVRVHKEEIGQTCMKMLLERLHNPQMAFSKRILPTEFVIRGRSVTFKKPLEIQREMVLPVPSRVGGSWSSFLARPDGGTEDDDLLRRSNQKGAPREAAAAVRNQPTSAANHQERSFVEVVEDLPGPANGEVDALELVYIGFQTRIESGIA